MHVLCMPTTTTTITILYSTKSVSACTVYAYNNNNNYTLFNPKCQCTYCVCPTTRTRTILYSTQNVSASTLYALQQEELCFIHLRVSVHVLCMPYNKNKNYTLLNPECLCMYCVCPTTITIFNPECQCMYCVCLATITITILYSTQQEVKAMHQFTVSLYLKPYPQDTCVISCNLPHALLAECLGRLYVLLTMEKKIIPPFLLRAFEHESGALPLSHPHTPYHHRI